ncbi:MAG TPA: LptF/LptG family permease [Vicinamibacteria bacterium]|nr:LptF/LptG family permease [Vicinamibacteria bacterium]
MTSLRRLRPTILDRYVAREIWPPFGLGLLLFTFILLLDQISHLTKVLVSRGADFPTVFKAFAYLLPSIFSVTIPMAFLMGVLLAFGRMASDSEIVALRATGVSPARLLRPVVALSLVATMATFYVVAIALPAANQAYREIIFALIISRARTGITPRVFNDDLLPGGNIVLYVSDIPAQTNQWRNLLVYDTRTPQRPRTIVARGGRVNVDRSRQRVELDLEDGATYTFNTMAPDQIDVDQYIRARYPLPYDEFFPNIPLAKGDREMSLGDLRKEVASLRAQGKGPKETGRFEVEYHKKFAIPVACVVFGFLGLGLSLGSRKEARSAAFGLSIAVIFVYYVIIRLGEQAGDTGIMPPALAMWGANVTLGIAALVLLVLNHREAAFDPLDPTHYRALLPAVRLKKGQPAAVAAAPRRGPRRVVVIRVPRVGLPIPGLIDRYIARSYVSKLALVLTAFWALFVLASFLDLFDDVQQNRVKGAVVFHYYAFASPKMVHLIAPVSVLVTVLITLGILARNNEITAMKAAGISLYRVVIPVVVLGAAVGFVMFEGAEYVLPPMNKVAERDFNVIKGRPPQASTLNQHRWILGSDGRFYNYDYFQKADARQGITLYGLSVYDVDPATWRLRDRRFAARAVWDAGRGVYELERGWRRRFVGEGCEGSVAGQAAECFREFTQTTDRHLEAPSYFDKEERAADTMSFGELQDHIRSVEALGLDVTRLRVELHRKIAYPAVALVMTLLAIPFSFVVARHGALYGVAVSLFIAIVYWACIAVFDALGNNGLLPPPLAAWAPNLLFAASGLYFLFTLDT